MTVKKLKQLLSDLDDTLKVEGNDLGNLIIYNEDGIYIGYIDFNTELIDLMDYDSTDLGIEL